MKLLIINYMTLPLPPVKGGAVEYLVDAFLKFNELNHHHDITLYSIYDEQAEKEAKNYKYTKIKYIKIESLFDKADRAMRHIINKFTPMYVGNTYISKIARIEKDLSKYDAVIFENAPEFVLKMPKKFKDKYILHLHNDFLNIDFKYANKIFDLYNKIYTISDSLGACVQSIKKSDKVMTLYNGIDLKKFSFNADTRKEMRKKYGFSDDDFVFMYCGRVVPDKGVYELVQAFNKLKGNNYKLLIVGGTGYSRFNETEYLKKIRAIGDERITLTGFLPYSEISALYTLPDVGVVPSIFNDPFNLTSIEFCANGIPIIISDRGAMKELVNEKCSVIAKCDEDFVGNIYDALVEMISRADTYGEMSAEAKKVSENFSIEQYCKRFDELLQD